MLLCAFCFAFAEGENGAAGSRLLCRVIVLKDSVGVLFAFAEYFLFATRKRERWKGGVETSVSRYCLEGPRLAVCFLFATEREREYERPFATCLDRFSL